MKVKKQYESGKNNITLHNLLLFLTKNMQYHPTILTMLLDLGDTIQKLQSYNEASFPILSVYLSIPDGLKKQRKQNNALHKYFQNLIEEGLDEKERKALQQDILYMDSFLQQFKNTDGFRGLALFSGGNKVWEVITTHFPFQPTLAINHAAYLEPLLKELNDYRRYLVVVADRDKARFFTLYSGELEDQAEVNNEHIWQEVPPNVKGRNMGMRADKVSRHIQDHLRRHFDSVSRKVFNFVKNKPVTGVIIGSHKELIHQFEKQLPKNLRSKIVGEFITEPDAPPNWILEKSKQIVEEVNKKLQVQQSPNLSST